MVTILFGAYYQRHLKTVIPVVARKAGEPIPVRLSAAKISEITELVAATGVAGSSRSVRLFCSQPGKIVYLPVEIGDIVEEGQVVVRLENRDLDIALEAQKLKLKRSQAENALYGELFKFRESLVNRNLVEAFQLIEDRFKSQMAGIDEEIAIKELRRAEEGIKNLEISSPIRGAVISRQANLGEQVFEKDRLLTIGDYDPIHVVADVAEPMIKYLAVGDSAKIRFEAFPNRELTGKIDRIHPRSDPTKKTVEVVLEIANPNRDILPGMSAFLQFSSTKTSLVIPRLAVVSSVDKHAVYVVESGVARAVNVKTGRVAEKEIEVIEGLQEGDQVVVFGNLSLFEGAEVRVLPNTSE